MSKNNPYFCVFCGDTLKNKNTEQQHRKKCLKFKELCNAKKRKCRLCGLKPIVKLASHFKKDHPEWLKKPKRNEPTQKNETNAKKHVVKGMLLVKLEKLPDYFLSTATEEPSVANSEMCDFCDRIFLNKRALKIHEMLCRM